MKRIYLFLILFLLVFLTGCGEVIEIPREEDGSSPIKVTEGRGDYKLFKESLVNEWVLDDPDDYDVDGDPRTDQETIYGFNENGTYYIEYHNKNDRGYVMREEPDILVEGDYSIKDNKLTLEDGTAASDDPVTYTFSIVGEEMKWTAANGTVFKFKQI